MVHKFRNPQAASQNSGFKMYLHGSAVRHRPD